MRGADLAHRTAEYAGPSCINGYQPGRRGTATFLVPYPARHGPSVQGVRRKGNCVYDGTTAYLF